MTDTLPISLVTGFLGSGKTTLLSHLLKTLAGRRVLFLVNEFAARDVDGARLLAQREDAVVVTLAGGSIFCRCLAGSFIETLVKVHQRAVAEGIDGVIVEASGMADPRVVDQLLAESGLGDRFHLACVIAVVDPVTFPKLRVTLPVITRQVEAADVVVINKIDRVDSSAVSGAVEEVRTINPQARVITCRYGEVALDPFRAGGVTRRGELAECRDATLDRRDLAAGVVMDEATLRELLARGGDGLLRCKGVVTDERGQRFEVDYDASVLSRRPMRGDEADTGLVLIFRAESALTVDLLLDRVAYQQELPS